MIKKFTPDIEPDPLYEHAVHACQREDKTDTRWLMKELHISFARASNLLAAMEGRGDVSAIGEDGRREVRA